MLGDNIPHNREIISHFFILIILTDIKCFCYKDKP